MLLEWHEHEPELPMGQPYVEEGELTGKRRFVRAPYPTRDAMTALVLQVEYCVCCEGKWTTAWRFATAADVLLEDVIDLPANGG
ncbi:hypothetical protein [Tardiphaga sp. 367_B4_N1_1]|uniref:hypothetical protein n=1 Tax=Tardiphaga sp. 367_B4_N1_1 TaxID=3240777 RepID=UPI003F2776A4